MKVFINPGHVPNGAPDPGAVNPKTKDRECDYVLTCGEMLQTYLNDVGIETMMLQSDSLSEVCETSNEWMADIFISLHCNASNEHNARGTETYYLSQRGKELAEKIQAQMVDSVYTLDRGIKPASFFVLRNTNAISVLIELAFIDEPSDLFLLRNDLDELAKAIARGVTDFI